MLEETLPLYKPLGLKIKTGSYMPGDVTSFCLFYLFVLPAKKKHFKLEKILSSKIARTLMLNAKTLEET